MDGFWAQKLPRGPYRPMSAVRYAAYGPSERGWEMPQVRLVLGRASHDGAYSTVGRIESRRRAASATIASVAAKFVGTPPMSVYWERSAAGTSACVAYGWPAAQLKATRILSTPLATIRFSCCSRFTPDAPSNRGPSALTPTKPWGTGPSGLAGVRLAWAAPAPKASPARAISSSTELPVRRTRRGISGGAGASGATSEQYAPADHRDPEAPGEPAVIAGEREAGGPGGGGGGRRGVGDG